MSRRDDRAKELRDGLFRQGILTPRGDRERGANEGLSAREIKGLSEENGRAWGLHFGSGFIKQRARDAQKQAKGKHKK
jgi:hypothetical protein